MTIRISEPPASIGVSKPIAGRDEDPTVYSCEPVPHSGPSTALCTALSARTAAIHKPVVNPEVVLHRGRDQMVRLFDGSNKELREGEVLLHGKRDGEACGDPRVRRQVIDELLCGVTGSTSLCTMRPSKWNEMSTYKSTLSSMVCHQQAKAEFSGFFGLNEPVVKEVKI